MSGSAEKLEGMDAIWELDTDEEKEVNISYSLNSYIREGKAHLCQPGQNSKLHLQNVLRRRKREVCNQRQLKQKQEKNRIRLVGAEGTSLEYEFTTDIGEVGTFGG